MVPVSWGRRQDINTNVSQPGSRREQYPDGKPYAPSTYPPYDFEDPKQSFKRVGDMLIEEACAELGPGYEMPPAEVTWVREMLEYNVAVGRDIRRRGQTARFLRAREFFQHTPVRSDPAGREER